MIRTTEYLGYLKKVMFEGEEELNQRTGLKTKRLLGTIVDLTREDGIFSPRKVSAKVAAAEAAWMLMGTTETAWINRQTNIWKKFEDEGNPGTISTAYGFRLRHAFNGRDQILEAIEILKEDPSTRQCLLMNWDPRVDGLMRQGRSKNVPCPFSFQLLVTGGEGFAVVYQRSADSVIGIPYDLMYYYILAQAVFNSAGYPFYGVRIMVGDAHVYENHYELAERMLGCELPNHPHYLRHSWTVDEILERPDDFVSNFAGVYKGVEWPIVEKLEAAQ